jgi:hypothetical protein
VDLAALVACLLAVHGLLLFSELHYRHRDYFSLALRRRPVSIFTPIAIESVVGFAAVVWAVRPKTDSSQAQILGAALTGLLLAGAPEALGRIFEQVLNERIAKASSALLSVVMRLSRQNFRRAVDDLRKEDCIRYRNSEEEWHAPGTDRRARTRRLRMLYELHKIEIASAQRDSGLLYRDRFPQYQNFYVLVDFLGRARLREQLTTGQIDSPREAWDGREERTRRGGSAPDRAGGGGASAGKVRCYDDEELKRRIDSGTLGASYGEGTQRQERN